MLAKSEHFYIEVKHKTAIRFFIIDFKQLRSNKESNKIF